jgi:hypothetical protein
MEIPLQAQVECTDGVCGRSVYVLINPVAEKVTHLVVREDSSPYTEYIVPVEVISATIVDTIQLRCSKAELEKMDPFVQTEFVEEKVPSGGFLLVMECTEWDHTTTYPMLPLTEKHTSP